MILISYSGSGRKYNAVFVQLIGSKSTSKKKRMELSGYVCRIYAWEKFIHIPSEAGGDQSA